MNIFFGLDKSYVDVNISVETFNSEYTTKRSAQKNKLTLNSRDNLKFE